MNVNLELYRVFCEVVKYKNISKTAENMYISQSAVTQSIQKLENLLGGKIFYRNKNGVELTEEGKNLYNYIKDGFETLNNAENLFSKYITLEKGTIRIGGGNSLLSYLIFEPLILFMKKYPNINISIVSGVTDNLMHQLSNGELDLVVLNLPFKTKSYSNIEITSLKKSKFCFYASKKYIKEHPYKSLKELDNHTLLIPKEPSAKNRILDKYCIENDLTLNPQYKISSVSLMKKMVLNDVGIGFTNKENLQDIREHIDILETIQMNSTEEGIASLKKNICNKATLELIKTIKSYYKED